MSEAENLFAQAIIGSGKQLRTFSLLTGTVKAIEGDTCTVDAYEDVRLNAVIDTLESQITVYPKIGSVVVIGRLNDSDNMFVVCTSEIDKVTIKINGLLFEMADGKFKIKNDGANLKEILSTAFNQLNNAIITTPSGPGQFSPADKLVFQDLKTKTNQLLS